jgi:dUTP pyrophosphatase
MSAPSETLSAAQTPVDTHHLDPSDFKGMEEYIHALTISERPQLTRIAENQPVAMGHPNILSVPLHDPSNTWLEFLCVEKMAIDAYIPVKESSDNAGYDLFAYEPGFVPAWGMLLVKTKIKVAIPPNLYGRIASRSGMSLKGNIEVGAGVVDRNYRGELCVVLRNFSDYPYEVKKGDRIAQLILTPYRTVPVKHTRDLVSLFGQTDRGAGGFGSSGK